MGNTSISATETEHAGREKTLTEVMNALASAEFIYVDKSYIVNLRQIESIKKDQLVLRDGSMVRISRPRYRKVREQLIAYWRREV